MDRLVWRNDQEQWVKNNIDSHKLICFIHMQTNLISKKSETIFTLLMLFLQLFLFWPISGQLYWILLYTAAFYRRCEHWHCSIVMVLQLWMGWLPGHSFNLLFLGEHMAAEIVGSKTGSQVEKRERINFFCCLFHMLTPVLTLVLRRFFPGDVVLAGGTVGRGGGHEWGEMFRDRADPGPVSPPWKAPQLSQGRRTLRCRGVLHTG